MGIPFQSQKKDRVAGACNCSQPDYHDLRMLLDHVAEELAEEYIRLMEASVEREAGK